MATTVGQLVIDMAADIARLRKDMDRAANTVEGAMDRIRRSANKAFAALGVGVSVAGLTAFVKSAIDAADRMGELSQATGVAVKDLAGLELAFKTNGLQADAMQTALSKLSVAIAANDKAITGLGVSTKNADGSLKSTRQVLGEVADRFASTQDGAIKTANAINLFGKSGAALVPLLNSGAAGLAEMDAAARKLGVTIDGETARKAGQFNDTLDLLGAAFRGIGAQLAAQLLPTLQTLAGLFLEAANKGATLRIAADGISAVLRGLYIAGVAVAEVFFQIGNTVAGAASAIGLAARGQFQAARDALALMSQGNVSSFQDAAAKIEAAWKNAGSSVVAQATAGAMATQTYTGEATKAADATKKLAEEERKRRENFAAQIADQRLLNTLIAQGVPAEEARARIQLARQGATGREIALLESLRVKEQALLDIRKQAVEEAEAELKAQNDYLLAAEKQAAAVAEQVKSIEAQVKAQLEANETLGVTGVALAEVEAARLRDAAATALQRAEELAKNPVTQAEAEQVRELAAQYTKLADAKVAGALKAADIDRAKDAIEAQQREAQGLQKIFDDVGRSLTDSLFRGFEAGKGFLRSFKDSIVNTFKSLVVRFAVQPVLTSIAGSIAGALGFSGAAQAAGTGANALSLLSNASTIGNIFSNGLTGAVSNGLSSLSGTLFNSGLTGASSLVDGLNKGLNIGSSFITSGIGSLATSIGSGLSAAGFAGAANFVNGFGAGLTGGFSAISGTGGAFSVGGALGAAAPFIGGALAIASLFGLFGGGPKAIGTNIVETAPGEFERRRGKAGFLDKGQVDPTLTAINKQFRDTLEKLVGRPVNELLIGVKAGLFDNRERSTADLKVFDASIGTGKGQAIIDLQLKGSAKKLGENIQKLATESLGKPLRDAFLRVATNLSDTVRDFLKGSDETTEIQKRIAGFQQLTAASARLNENLGLTVDQVLLMSDSLGGIEQAVGLLDGVLADVPLTQADLQRQVDSVAVSFRQLGVAMPGTAAGFRELIRSIDKTTPEGRELAAALLNLAPAFAGAINGVAGFKAALEQQIGTLFGELQQRLATAQSNLDAAKGALQTGIQDAIGVETAKLDALRQARLDQIAALEEERGALQGLISERESARSALIQGIRSEIERLRSETTEINGQTREQAESALRSAFERESNALREAFERDSAGLQDTINRFGSVTQTLRDFQRELTGQIAGASGGGLGFARAQFADVARRAQLGDESAIALLPEVGQALRDASAEGAVTREEFLRDLVTIAKATNSTAGVADRQKQIAEQQLAALKAAHDTAQKALKAQVSAFIAIDDVADNTLTVAQAIANLQAITSAAAATGTSNNAALIATLEAELAALGESLGGGSTLEELRGQFQTANAAAAAAESKLGSIDQQIAALQNATAAEAHQEALIGKLNEMLAALGTTPKTIEELQTEFDTAKDVFDKAQEDVNKATDLLTDAGLLTQTDRDILGELTTALNDLAKVTDTLDAANDAAIDTVADQREAEELARLAREALAADKSALRLVKGFGAKNDKVINLLSDSTITKVADVLGNADKTKFDVKGAKLKEEQIEQALAALIGVAAADLAGLNATLLKSLALAAGFDEGDLARQLGIPGFAAGGTFGGGLRIVGERGPELEATGPSRIFSANQTRDILSGGNDKLAASVERLTQEVSMLRAEARATAVASTKTADILFRATDGGQDYIRNIEAAA